MKQGIFEAWKSLLKLLRFVAWYVIAVATAFYVLPIAGLFLEGQYDVMSSSAKLFSILVFFTVIAVWQITSWKNRLRASSRNQEAGRVSSSTE